jgi:uncharacterized protein YbjT (DUF2867 family)
MKVVLFGGTGMIGAGVLMECLVDSRVQTVLSISRSATGLKHPKLRELIRSDFTKFSDIKSELTGLNACFFCLGISSAGMTEAAYQLVTYDLTIAAAETLASASPGIVLVFVTGIGTDSTETSRVMWARVKGRTENALLAMPGIKAYMFRPGFIQPMKGIRSKTGLYRAFYAIMSPLYPILKRVFPAHITNTEQVGHAMIAVAANGYSKRILETRDINAVAARS